MLKFPLRIAVFAMMALGNTVACVGSASADTYPSRPIQVIVPFPTGGGVDTIAQNRSAKNARVFGAVARY